METIVEYTDAKPAQNRYPQRIISPSHAQACCFSDIEAVGAVHTDGPWEYQYKCCRTCGFTVRTILRAIPDEALLRDLRHVLQNAFQRNVPDL